MIDLADVHVTLGDQPVLAGVDLTVERGELVGLVGPNGAGKTTLLRTVNGLLEPDRGTVTVDGDRVDRLGSKAVSRRVATVPQDAHVGFAFTVEAVVEMGRTPHRSRLDWTDDADAVETALERTETAGLRDRTVDEVSGGERQRVLLARALAQAAPVLVLDEPTASLDVNHQVRVLELVRDLVDDGRTVVAAIHDLDLAARYCDRLALLSDGEVAAAGDPRSVLESAGLGAAFATDAAVTDNPVVGTPTVTAVTRGDRRDRHVHVLGTGRRAARAVGACWRAGFAVSVGPVPEGDAAATLAGDLDVDAVTTPPFEAVDPSDREAVRDRLDAADAVVRAGPTAGIDLLDGEATGVVEWPDGDGPGPGGDPADGIRGHDGAAADAIAAVVAEAASETPADD